MSLEHKIDFKVVISVKDANPNGDPLNGNRPRQTMEGYGVILCITHHIAGIQAMVGD